MKRIGRVLWPMLPFLLVAGACVGLLGCPVVPGHDAGTSSTMDSNREGPEGDPSEAGVARLGVVGSLDPHDGVMEGQTYSIRGRFLSVGGLATQVRNRHMRVEGRFASPSRGN